MSRAPLLLALVLLAAPLSGCTLWPFGGDDGDAPAAGDGAGGNSTRPPPAPEGPFFEDALQNATRAVAAAFPDESARLSRASAVVNAHGELAAEATFVFHHGPERYEDAWRSAYADAGRFVQVVVPANDPASPRVTSGAPLPMAQGLRFDAGGPATTAGDALAAATAIVPSAHGVWTLDLLPFSCPNRDGASWHVGNYSHAVRVDAATGDACTNAELPGSLVPRLVTIADVPHGGFRVDAGASVTVPIDMSVTTLTNPAGGFSFALALTGAGPNHEVVPANATLPPGFSVRVDPPVVTPTGTGLLRVNVTLTTDPGTEAGAYKFVVHSRSDAPDFSAGVDEPLRVLVQSP